MDMDATYRPVINVREKICRIGKREMLWKHYNLRKENSLIVDNAKLLLIGEFMDAYGYEKTFENEKFVIFE